MSSQLRPCGASVSELYGLQGMQGIDSLVQEGKNKLSKVRAILQALHPAAPRVLFSNTQPSPVLAVLFALIKPLKLIL
jgi:hypothetical protein